MILIQHFSCSLQRYNFFLPTKIRHILILWCEKFLYSVNESSTHRARFAVLVDNPALTSFRKASCVPQFTWVKIEIIRLKCLCIPLRANMASSTVTARHEEAIPLLIVANYAYFSVIQLIRRISTVLSGLQIFFWITCSIREWNRLGWRQMASLGCCRSLYNLVIPTLPQILEDQSDNYHKRNCNICEDNNP